MLASRGERGGLLLWCYQNSAALRISARGLLLASRGERRERGGMLCVVIRTLRLCVSLRENFLATRGERGGRGGLLLCWRVRPISAALRISARGLLLASRGERRERGGMLCVVIRTLRLCVSLRENFLASRGVRGERRGLLLCWRVRPISAPQRSLREDFVVTRGERGGRGGLLLCCCQNSAALCSLREIRVVEERFQKSLTMRLIPFLSTDLLKFITNPTLLSAMRRYVRSCL